jgi:group I intron endonuclease
VRELHLWARYNRQMHWAYVVYAHTNVKNGKPYIGWAVIAEGQTPHDAMMRRWTEHCENARHGCNFLISSAIRKHGADVFSHAVLDTLVTLKGAKHAETLWIAQRKTYAFDHDGHGYNMTRGGDGVLGMRGYHHTAVAKECIGAGNCGLVRTPEMKLVTSVTTKAAMTPDIVSKVKQRTREALADPVVRAKLEANNYSKSRKRVVQTTTTGEFIAEYASASEANRLTGVNKGNLAACARGKTLQAGGFVWRYVS